MVRKIELTCAQMRPDFLQRFHYTSIVFIYCSLTAGQHISIHFAPTPLSGIYVVVIMKA